MAYFLHIYIVDSAKETMMKKKMTKKEIERFIANNKAIRSSGPWARSVRAWLEQGGRPS